MFMAVAFIVTFYVLRQSMGDIILINVEEQKVFDSIALILNNAKVSFVEKPAEFPIGTGSIRVLTRKSSNVVMLQLVNTKGYFPLLFGELRETFRNYRISKIPLGALRLFFPFIPLIFIMTLNSPVLKELLDIDLSSFGSLPRRIGGYGTWGMYLSGQLFGIILMILSVRVWIKRPLALTPSAFRWGGVLVIFNLLSLCLVSLINFHLHLGLLFLELSICGLILYYLRIANRYYWFKNISSETLHGALNETLNRFNISSSASRHGYLLEDGTEINVQVSYQGILVESSKPEAHKELIRALLDSVKKKPATIFVSENLLILLGSLIVTAYWFSPLLLRLFFR